MAITKRFVPESKCTKTANTRSKIYNKLAFIVSPSRGPSAVLPGVGDEIFSPYTIVVGLSRIAVGPVERL